MSKKTYSQAEDTPSKEQVIEVIKVDGVTYYKFNQAALNQVVKDILYIKELEGEISLRDAQLANKERSYQYALLTIEDLKEIIISLETERDSIQMLYDMSDEEIDRLIKDMKKIKRKVWFRGFVTGFGSGTVVTAILIIVLLA